MEPVKEYEANYKYSVILQKSIFANSDGEAILQAKEMADEGTVGFTKVFVVPGSMGDEVDSLYFEELLDLVRDRLKVDSDSRGWEIVFVEYVKTEK